MEVDEPSYDILEWFPILVCQKVFKYLDGNDVIQASGVSKEWRKFASEKQQMKKVKLVFNQYNSQRLNLKSVNMIQKSKRKYQNIEFRGISYRFSEYVPRVLALRAGSWKSVRISRCSFFDHAMWAAVLATIEPSVEELSFTELYMMQTTVDANSTWTFPCLKILEGDSQTSSLCNVFIRCTSLVKLDWRCHSFQPPEVKSTLLRNNHNLEDLTTTTDDISLEDLVDFKFKLKKLRLHSPLGLRTSLDTTQLFLETQAQTLETLKMDARLNRDILELILNMPRLTSFTTSFFDVEEAISGEALPLPENTSITYLEFKYWGQQPQHSFGTFFRSLTNLKHFKCRYIDDQKFFALARAVPALESFEATNFNVSRFPEGDIFPNMKEFKVKKFKHGLQEPTGDGNFASLARQEMRKIR